MTQLVGDLPSWTNGGGLLLAWILTALVLTLIWAWLCRDRCGTCQRRIPPGQHRYRRWLWVETCDGRRFEMFEAVCRKCFRARAGRDA